MNFATLEGDTIHYNAVAWAVDTLSLGGLGTRLELFRLSECVWGRGRDFVLGMPVCVDAM